MTNRVVLEPSGLKVSKPGVNVLTAGPSGLQFSSDWNALGFYQGGEIDCDWNETDFRNYALGKTFASPPMVCFQRADGSGLENFEMNEFFWSFETSLSNYHRVEVTVTGTHIRIKSWRAGTNPTFRLRYTILDYSL